MVDAQQTKRKLPTVKDVLAKKKITKSSGAKKTAAKVYVVIDYPQTGDLIQSDHYAIRIGMSGGETVEIAIDETPWQPCRPANGYYWFDWYGFTPGEHTLIARAKIGAQYIRSKAISCLI